MGIGTATLMIAEQLRNGAIPVALLRQYALDGKLTANVVRLIRRVVIVGEGGAGKSTLLKQLLARAAATGRVPAWVSLAALPSDGPLTVAALVDHLVKEAESRLGVAEINRAESYWRLTFRTSLRNVSGGALALRARAIAAGGDGIGAHAAVAAAVMELSLIHI